MSEKLVPRWLEVGEEFDLFKGKFLAGQDGAIFEALHGGGFALIIYLSNMNNKEKELLRKGKIQVRVIRETDYFVLTLVRFASSPLIFEIVFDPLLYKDEREDQLGDSNIVYIVGIESNTNIIQTLRMANMPVRLYHIFQSSWEKAKDIPDFSTKYNRWIEDLEKRYSVLELWDMGEYVGKMGEKLL